MVPLHLQQWGEARKIGELPDVSRENGIYTAIIHSIYPVNKEKGVVSHGTLQTRVCGGGESGKEVQTMYVYILEFVYAAEDRETVEKWLAQAELGGVLLSSEPYDDEILAILASSRAFGEKSRKLRQHPLISSCEAKQCAMYRITTTTAPGWVLHSFPLREGEEWYPGSRQTAYLCLQSHQLSNEQISWLATSTAIVGWEYAFDLAPLPVGC